MFFALPALCGEWELKSVLLVEMEHFPEGQASGTIGWQVKQGSGPYFSSEYHTRGVGTTGHTNNDNVL